MVGDESGNKTSSAGFESPLDDQDPKASIAGLERQLRQIEEHADRAAKDWSALMRSRAQEDKRFRATQQREDKNFRATYEREEEDRWERRTRDDEHLQLRRHLEDLSLQEERLREDEEKLKAHRQAEEQLKRRRRLEDSTLYMKRFEASKKKTNVRRHLSRLKRTLPEIDGEVSSPLSKNNKHLKA